MSPPETPPDLAAWVAAFDFDRDPPKIMTTVNGFEPGMSFETAASPDVDAFKKKGGKILFFHGVADPVFSSLDTIAYELHAMLAEAVRNTQPQLVRNTQPEPVRDAQPAPKRNTRTRPAPKRTAKIKSARAPARRKRPR